MNTSVKDLRGQLAFIGIKNVSSYFSVFAANLRSHFKSSSKRSACASSSSDNVGKFLFMMRSIMMRHAIQMKSREENRSIMTLPPKVRLNGVFIPSHHVRLAFLISFLIQFSLFLLPLGGKGSVNNFQR